MHRQLHWLDVKDRVNYKIGLLVYKCLHGLVPRYLSEQCIEASTFMGRVNMRSSLQFGRQLHVPRTKTKTLGSREFYATPHLPCGTRSRRTCVIPDSRSTPSEQTEISLSQSINFLFSFLYPIIVAFFAVRANVMLISWRVQMSELNASRNKIKAALSWYKATLNTLHLFIYSFIYKSVHN